MLPSTWVETLFWEGLDLEKRRIPKLVSFSVEIDGLEVRSVDRSTDRRSPP